MFRKYESIPREIEAEQYFAYMKPDIEGFSSIRRALAPDPNNPLAPQETTIIGGQIQTMEKDENGNPVFIHVPPGHYIIREVNQKQFRILSPGEFEYHFSEVGAK